MAAGAAVAHSSVCVATAAFVDEHHQAEADDQIASVKKVAEVYELIKTNQPLLLIQHNSQQLAYSLLTEAMRALNVALSLIKHLPAPAASSAAAAIPVTTSMIKAEATPANSNDHGADNHVVGKARRSSAAKRKRINGEDKSSCFQLTTAAPHEDGYQWRKYGEKKIQGTHFTRSYFRCTYRDDKGCQATRQIQQKDNNYPPMFQVTYNNDHTCNSSCNTSYTNNNNLALPLANNNPNGCHKDGAVCSKMIKQEPQAAPWLPPPPLPIISDNLDETPALHLCQDVPPSSNILHSNSAAAVCSYTDQFDNHQMDQQLETTVFEEALGLGADLDDPYFYDPNLLLYENLMNCY
uniref:WRKY domain-containing protein n=1 Tax=Leersia perrieri TaxID=77586 RepID=A0A0D9XNE9_9ORYZ